MILIFDTETTGLPKNYKAPYTDSDNWPRLVQLAMQVYDYDFKLVIEHNFIIKPQGFTIPVEASNVHRITNERALNEGLSLSHALGCLLAQVKQADLIVGHNIGFDMNIVSAELYRLGQDAKIVMHKPVQCTMMKSTNYCQIQGNYGYKWPKLSELHYKLFGNDFEEAHDAMNDVKATAKCLFELVRIGVIKLN